MSETLFEGCRLTADDGYVFDYGIPEFEIDDDLIKEYVRDNSVWSTNNYPTLTFTCRVNFIELYKLIGLWDWVMRYCPNKRVVHLMKYGKNDKVKLKNCRRALRLIEKEVNSRYDQT